MNNNDGLKKLWDMVDYNQIDKNVLADMTNKGDLGELVSDGVIQIAELADKFGGKYKKEMDKLNTLNIIIAGKTGVGKSTLINGIFGQEYAKTGIGKPVTQHTDKITGDKPLVIYDTKGFELGENAQKEVKDEIIKLISNGNKSNNISEMIHCVWYCINTASSRVEEKEIELLRQLTSEKEVAQVPVIVILTQAFDSKKAKEMRNYILEQKLNIMEVVPVLAQDYEIDEEYTKKAYGLKELLQLMIQRLPESLQTTIINVQTASLELKIDKAKKIVKTCAVGSVLECFVPIPLADSAMLVPTQATMLARITATFGLKIDKGFIATALSTVLGTGGASLAGKTIAKQLIKLLPGGNIVGGVISGSTAGLITLALGQAYIQLMEAVYKGELKSSEIGAEKGTEMLKELLKRRLDANSNVSKKDILKGNVNNDF